MTSASSVAIRIEADAERPAGFAVVTVERALPEPVRFTLRRETGDALWLGPEGWQSDPGSLAARETALADGRTRFLVGPEVVDQIAYLEPVSFGFPEAGCHGSAFWPEVATSGLTTRSRRIGAVRPPADPGRPEPAGPAAGAAPGPEVEPPVREVAPAAGGARRRGLLAAGLALALLGITGAAYWLRRPPADAPAAASVPAPVDPMARLRQLARSGSPDEIGAFGREMLGAGNGEIGFQAIDIAAQRGEGEALLQIGRWYDPRHFEAAGRRFSRASAEQAARYYRDAAARSAPGARDALDGLCRSLTESLPDDAGDRAAREAESVLRRSCTP